MNAKDALKRLQNGNSRYLAEMNNQNVSQTRRDSLVTEQNPFAVILSCADSRVPPEIIFDQGLGDLFVIRVAGNVITSEVVGSVEFAIHQLACRLVVVLGHSDCGAVSTTLAEIANPTPNLSPNLQSLVDCIRPSITPLLEKNELSVSDQQALMPQAVEANVHQSVAQLQQNSAIVQNLVQAHDLKIVGAEYSLTTGKVTFFNSGSW